MSGLAETLAEAGHTVRLVFIGDPALPGQEARVGGRLVLHRWCQWISQYHTYGVFDGEEGKLRDLNDSAPPFVVDEVVRPAIGQGHSVVILGEEWHTAEAMCQISDRLRQVRLGDRAVVLWDANNTMGFDRIDWHWHRNAPA